MLHDILIIDDDFSGEAVLDEMALKSQTSSNNSAWEQTIMLFYFGLIRENLKVIWSTGELGDLEKLDKHHLSKIKYIICDLHLTGIKETDNNKTIISKIMGIMDELNTRFNEKEINFLVNSKYIDRHKNIEIELQNALHTKYQTKYSVTAFSQKNAIAKEQKQKLLNASLLSHIKEQIIKKHLEVERWFNQKIGIKDEVLQELNFFSKHKIVKKSHNLNGNNKQITNLNDSRNTIAHNQIDLLNDLEGIEKIDPEIKKIKQFSDLFPYLEKIDKLITSITNALLK